MIPSIVHFTWIGPRIPFAYVFAVRSAAMRGELEQTILHHTDPLTEGPALELLRNTPGATLRRLSPDELLGQAGADLGVGDALADLYRRVENAVARSNILRAALLHVQGGIYLDLDTITVRSLRPLLDATQFLGHERIVWPHFVRHGHAWGPKLHSALLSVTRDVLRELPHGHVAFRAIEGRYHLGINGAIVGGAPKAPLMASYLRAMTRVPREAQQRKHALGTHLLQQEVERYTGGDLVIHPPAVFYPLAPEISEHWFRIQRRVHLDRAVLPETRVVHWYASVRTKSLMPQIAPDYVRRHAHNQLYSALALPFVG